MGSRSTYVGVYLKTIPSKETVKETFRVKPDGKRVKSRFNPETGEEYDLMTIEKVVDESVNLYDVELDGFVEDEFFTTESFENTWIPNFSKYNLIEGDDEHEVELDLSNIDVKSVKDKFLEKYSPYIEEIRKHGDVEVKFGLLVYYL